MAEVVVEIVGRVLLEFVGVIATESISSYAQQRRTKKSTSYSQKYADSKPVLTTPLVHHNRAVLIASSNITFGNACERLVNIAFETSQIFPTIMSSYGNVDQYLRTELAKQYPDENFQIIISRNENVGCSVDDGEYFAEIIQDLYRVLVFTTKQNSHMKLDTHAANHRTLFQWS